MTKSNIIHSSFQHGNNFHIGHFCTIDPDVTVGDNVALGNYCYLKSGTRFASDINFADYCKTTGICYVGNHVNIRTGSCISKSVIVEDNAFIGAGIMTSHTKNIYHQRPTMPRQQHITRIGYAAVIGSHTNLSAGVTVGDNVVIGYGSVVTKDVPNQGIYVGHPLRKLRDLPAAMFIPKPNGYKPHTFPQDMLTKYLPYYR